MPFSYYVIDGFTICGTLRFKTRFSNYRGFICGTLNFKKKCFEMERMPVNDSTAFKIITFNSILPWVDTKTQCVKLPTFKTS